VVAYFGWELPKGRAIFEVGFNKKDNTPMGQGQSNTEPLVITTGFDDQLRGPLIIPDAGTIWEVGYAFASGIPIFGIFSKQQKPNLMLTQSCTASFENVGSFVDWLRSPTYELPKWKGPQQ
jgi:hypothetical protein